MRVQGRMVQTRIVGMSGSHRDTHKHERTIRKFRIVASLVKSVLLAWRMTDDVPWSPGTS